MSQQTERERRLAEQLRRNLRRRKASTAGEPSQTRDPDAEEPENRADEPRDGG